MDLLFGRDGGPGSAVRDTLEDGPFKFTIRLSWPNCRTTKAPLGTGVRRLQSPASKRALLRGSV